MDKRAYPNDEGYTVMPKKQDLAKWVSALREIYVRVRLGMDKSDAKKVVTAGWDNQELFDFNNWVRYNEGGDALKYTTAQAKSSFYMNERGDYYLPNPPNVPNLKNVPSPIASIQQIRQEADQLAANEQTERSGPSEHEQREANEAFRRKLISRLNSLEKYLGSQQGYIFAGKEFSNLLESVFRLKKQIQTHNTISVSAQTCLDLIIKEANILTRQGSSGAAGVMIKVAQDMPAPAGAVPLAPEIPPADPNAAPASAPTALPVGEPPIADKDAPKTGLEGFLQNLKDAGITDILEADDEVEIDEDEVEMDPKMASWGDLIVVEGQDAAANPDAALTDEAPTATAKPNFDALVDSAFNHLTINDLIAKLNDIDLIYKKREISNQLALAAVMFARLNLSHYFPAFNELSQKQMEANSYCSTRMQDILTALRGGVGKSNIDLTSPTSSTDPEAKLLAQHLENAQQKEQEAKAVKKQVENQQLENQAKPSIEVEDPGAALAPEAPAAPQRPAVPAPAGV